MATAPLTHSQNCANFFTTAVLTNLTYWQNNSAVQSLETEILDEEREGLMRAISFGLSVDDAWPVVSQLIETLSPYMERRGYWAIWEQILNQALDLARQRDDTARCVVFSLLLARLLQRQSKIKETIRQYRRTVYLTRRCVDQFNEARAYTNMGYLFIEQGRWLRAEVLCCRALAVFEQLNDLHGLAHTENHLGILYMRLGQWGEDKSILFQAQPHLERACNYWQMNQDDYGLVYGYTNLGMYYLLLEQANKALIYSEKALDYANQVGERTLIGSIAVNIGMAYELQKNYTQAEYFYLKAEKTFKQYCNAYELANVQKNLGSIYLAQQQQSRGFDYFTLSLAYWRKVNNSYHIMETMIYLGKCELARSNIRKASDWLEQAEKLSVHLPRASHRIIKELRETRHSILAQTVAG